MNSTTSRAAAFETAATAFRRPALGGPWFSPPDAAAATVGHGLPIAASSAPGRPEDSKYNFLQRGCPGMQIVVSPNRAGRPGNTVSRKIDGAYRTPGGKPDSKRPAVVYRFTYETTLLRGARARRQPLFPTGGPARLTRRRVSRSARREADMPGSSSRQPPLTRSAARCGDIDPQEQQGGKRVGKSSEALSRPRPLPPAGGLYRLPRSRFYLRPARLAPPRIISSRAFH